MIFSRKHVPKFFKPLAHFGINEQRLLWLIKVRFVALFCQLPLTFLGRYFGYLDQSDHIFFTLILVLAIGYNANLYRGVLEGKKKSNDLYLTLQMSLDLLLFTTLLLMSGSSSNPLYAFFYVMALLGGIFSSGKSSLCFAAVLFLCVLSVQIEPMLFSSAGLEVAFLPQTLPFILIQLFIPLITFLLARSFGDLLKRSQENLLSFAVHTERLDRLRALGALSAGFSHEFASPLQNAKLRINRLFAQGQQSEDLLECKLSIEDCETVLKRMNFAQLNFSESEVEVIDLSKVTREALHQWSELSPGVKVSFQSQLGLARLNRINFVQVLFNLLDNASEAMLEEKIISVEVTSSHETLQLSVRDNGQGFNKAILSRIGEPFNTNKTDGTGLGLYSTTLFMSSVGGKLRIWENSPKGTTVELTFPKVIV